jgi:hypothetical protein
MECELLLGVRAGGVPLTPCQPASAWAEHIYYISDIPCCQAPPSGSRPRLRAVADIGYAAGMSGSGEGGGIAGGTGGGETAYPVRKALGCTAEQWERVRAFRFGTEAEAVRRLLDLSMEAVGEGLLPAQADQHASGARDASS